MKFECAKMYVFVLAVFCVLCYMYLEYNSYIVPCEIYIQYESMCAENHCPFGEDLSNICACGRV